MKTLPTFEATCRLCGRTFSHPSAGDFSYGEAVLCNANGSAYATVDGSSALAQHVRSALGPSGPGALWKALAEIADKIDGEALTASIRCPHCASDDLLSWGGRMTGTREVPEASFEDYARMSAARLHRLQRRTPT
jgi:hypothetical protein